MAAATQQYDARRGALDAGTEARIRRLIEAGSTASEAPEDPFVRKPAPMDLSSTRRDEAAEIVAADQPAVPTADDIIAAEPGQRAGKDFAAPFPKTQMERAAESRTGPRLVGPDGIEARSIDQPEPEAPALPDPNAASILKWRPAPARGKAIPLPGAKGAGKIQRGMAEVGKQRAAAASEQKQRELDEAEELALEQDLIERGIIDENGRYINLDEHGRVMHRPQGLGELAWDPAAPGTGWRGRKPMDERRRGATPEEMEVPLTDRRFADDNGNRPPVLPGKGQYVWRGGSYSPRAPQLGILDNMDRNLITATPPKDQGQFFQWREAMKQLAVAAGFDIAKFESEEDLVKAGAQIAGDMQKRLGADWETGVAESGAPIFAPGEAATRRAEEGRLRADARQFVRTHQPDERLGKALIDAAEAGDWDTVAALKKEARNSRTASTAQAARDMRSMRGQVSNMRNPNVAPAMYFESIRNAGSPEELGRVQMAWAAAAPPAVGQRLNASGVALVGAAQNADQMEAERAHELAVAGAKANAEQQGLLPAQVATAQRNADTTLAADPMDWLTAVNNLALVYGAVSQQGGTLDHKDPRRAAQNHVSRTVMRTINDVSHPAVQSVLSTLYRESFPSGVAGAAAAVGDAAGRGLGGEGREKKFIRDAMTQAGLTEQQAVDFLRSQGVVIDQEQNQ